MRGCVCTGEGREIQRGGADERPEDGKDGNDQGAVGGDEGRIEGETNPGLDKEVGKLDVINESNEGERR